MHLVYVSFTCFTDKLNASIIYMCGCNNIGKWLGFDEYIYLPTKCMHVRLAGSLNNIVCVARMQLINPTAN